MAKKTTGKASGAGKKTRATRGKAQPVTRPRVASIERLMSFMCCSNSSVNFFCS